MKKVLLFIMILLVTGCTVVRIDTSNIDNIIGVVLSKENDLFNRIGKGYKYYIPRGVTYVDTAELNDTLYSSGNYYYLYIDVISYFNKVDKEYKVNSDAYYSKLIDKNGKKGYIEINEQDGKYFIEFMYNYAKIESLVERDEISSVVLNASYILSTIKFNDDVIKIMLNSDFFTNKEEVYDIFTIKKVNDRFLKIVDEGEN